MAPHNLTPNQFRVVRELVEAHRAGHTGEFAWILVSGREPAIKIFGSEKEVPAGKFDLLALEREGFLILEDRNGVPFGQLPQKALDAVDEAVGVVGISTEEDREDRFSRRYG